MGVQAGPSTSVFMADGSLPAALVFDCDVRARDPTRPVVSGVAFLANDCIYTLFTESGAAFAGADGQIADARAFRAGHGCGHDAHLL